MPTIVVRQDDPQRETTAAEGNPATVNEPNPNPTPVPAQESPPYDQSGPRRLVPVGEDVWPPEGAVDPHPLAIEDTRTIEVPAGFAVPSRSYGSGKAKDDLAKSQGKAEGQAPDVPNLPTGAIPVLGESGGGGDIPPIEEGGTPEIPPPTEEIDNPPATGGKAPDNTLPVGEDGEPLFQASSPSGTSESN